MSSSLDGDWGNKYLDKNRIATCGGQISRSTSDPANQVRSIVRGYVFMARLTSMWPAIVIMSMIVL